MKKIFVLFFAIIWAEGLFAQNKSFVAFCAKDGFPGHAFVSLGHEDEKQQMTIHDGTWGLYPKTSVEGGKSFVIGEVPGEIRDDLFTNSNHTYVIEVSEIEFNKTLKTINKWRKGTGYELLEKDCVTFIIEIANIYRDKIVIPKRKGLDNLPAEFIKKIKILNSK
jgi:hypothetical protein